MNNFKIKQYLPRVSSQLLEELEATEEGNKSCWMMLRYLMEEDGRELPQDWINRDEAQTSWEYLTPSSEPEDRLSYTLFNKYWLIISILHHNCDHRCCLYQSENILILHSRSLHSSSTDILMKMTGPWFCFCWLQTTRTVIFLPGLHSNTNCLHQPHHLSSSWLSSTVSHKEETTLVVVSDLLLETLAAWTLAAVQNCFSGSLETRGWSRWSRRAAPGCFCCYIQSSMLWCTKIIKGSLRWNLGNIFHLSLQFHSVSVSSPVVHEAVRHVPLQLGHVKEHTRRVSFQHVSSPPPWQGSESSSLWCCLHCDLGLAWLSDLHMTLCVHGYLATRASHACQHVTCLLVSERIVKTLETNSQSIKSLFSSTNWYYRTPETRYK